MRRRATPTTVKKTYNLPPKLVARVKRIYKAKTETEAIIRAMEAAAADEEIARAIRAVSSTLPGYQPLR